MTADREQTRRDGRDLLKRAQDAPAPSNEWDSVMIDLSEWAFENLEPLLAELEQAERERDEAQENRRDLSAENSAMRSRLAKVPALVEALRLALDHPNADDAQADARQALATWEQE